MERIVKDIPLNSEIIVMSCTHRGTIMMHERGLDKVISYIGKGTNRFWIHLGDWIEAITSDDKRFEIDSITDKTPKHQADAITQKFEPIKSQGITGLLGNHERKLRSITNFSKEICKDLDIPYGTGLCRIILSNEGNHLFNIFACHGGWLFNSQAKDPEQELANMKASMKMRMKKLMGDATVMCCGHAHKILIAPPSEELYLTDGIDGMKQHYLTTQYGADYINPNQRWYVCAGSFRRNYMDGYGDYAELYGPVQLGCIRIIIKDGKVDNIVPLRV